MFFYLLMNVQIILRMIILYIKSLFYLKGFGTECVPYGCFHKFCLSKEAFNK